MSALDMVLTALGVADPGRAASAVGSTPEALVGAIPTGFNQGLAGMVGTAYNAMVNAPRMVAGVGAVLMGRPDMAPTVREGTEAVTSALKAAGLGGMIATPAAGDLAANLVFKTSGLAPGFLVPEAAIGNLGDMAVGALAKASKLASSCPSCVGGLGRMGNTAGGAGDLMGSGGGVAKMLEQKALGFEKSAEDALSHLLDVVSDKSSEKK